MILGWIDERRKREGGGSGAGAARSIETASVLLTLSGFVLGAGAALGVFSFSPHAPVNVIYVLAVFVVFPILLLIPWVLAVVPRRWLEWLPGATALQEMARALSPGHWIPAAGRLFSASHRAKLESAWGAVKRFDRLYGRLRLWLVLEAAQRFAVAFHVGAIGCALALVVFTDMTFGWSTTLEVGAPRFHRAVTAFAAPWSGWSPVAAPSFDLVESTRYYRFEKQFAGDDGAEFSGRWWPFLILAMFVYGLTPRLLLWVIAQWRLRRAVANAPLDHAECQALYERLSEPLLATQSTESPGEPKPTATSPGDTPALSEGACWHVVRWCAEDLPEERARALTQGRLRGDVVSMLDAGGVDLNVDRATLDALGESASGASVVIYVKAWEPPTRDLMRFIEDAGKTLGERAQIAIAPFDEAESGEIVAPGKRDLDHWRSQMAALGDPYLRVVDVFERDGEGGEA